MCANGQTDLHIERTHTFLIFLVFFGQMNTH